MSKRSETNVDMCQFEGQVKTFGWENNLMFIKGP